MKIFVSEKEKLIEIGQDKINKAVTEFEGKAIDCLNFLTEHFISTFAEDVDIKLNGYKQDLDNLQNKYYQLEEKNQQLRKENEELKAYNLELHEFRKALSNQIQCENKKLAVEKLEELLSKIYESKCEEINLTLYIKWDDFLTEINSMIEELKGEQ